MQTVPGLSGLRDGSINAMFSGSWDANAVKEALGDNMGVAALPTYTLNGEEKQMTSYAGSKAIGVNPYSKKHGSCRRACTISWICQSTGKHTMR